MMIEFLISTFELNYFTILKQTIKPMYDERYSCVDGNWNPRRQRGPPKRYGRCWKRSRGLRSPMVGRGQVVIYTYIVYDREFWRTSGRIPGLDYNN
jgi:hypothetical protein